MKIPMSIIFLKAIKVVRIIVDRASLSGGNLGLADLSILKAAI